MGCWSGSLLGINEAIYWIALLPSHGQLPTTLRCEPISCALLSLKAAAWNNSVGVWDGIGDGSNPINCLIYSQ